jgi:hypothetical protein
MNLAKNPYSKVQKVFHPMLMLHDPDRKPGLTGMAV